MIHITKEYRSGEALHVVPVSCDEAAELYERALRAECDRLRADDPALAGRSDHELYAAAHASRDVRLALYAMERVGTRRAVEAHLDAVMARMARGAA